MKLHLTQTNFLAGLLDPTAQARSDTALYRNGALELLNCLPLAAGGQVSRWGTKHCAVLPEVPRMEEFAFSLEQSYIACFTKGRVDFFFAADGAAAGSLTVQPWTEAHLSQFSVTQGGDVMWVAHPDFPTRVIRRTGATSWAAADMSYDGAVGTPTFRYADQAITANWSAGFSVLVFSAPFLQAGHVGTVLRVFDEVAKVYRIGTVTAINSTTQAQMSWVGSAPPDDKPTLLWEEQAFSAVRGWPRTVCLHSQRLWFCGARDVGDALWASQVGRYFNFDVGTAKDAEAIAIAVGSTRVRAIIHAVSGQFLTLFTEQGVFFLPQEEARPLTPLNARPRMVAPYGSGRARPGAFDGGVLMVQSQGQAVRDIGYSTEAANLVAQPVSLGVTSFLGRIVDAAYLPGSQERPEQYALFVNDAGEIMLFHSVREERIGAWAGPWRTQGAFRAVGVSAGALFAAVEREGTIRLERFDASLAFDASLTMAQPYTVAHLPSRTVHGWTTAGEYLGQAETGPAGVAVFERQRWEADALPAGTQAQVGLAFDWAVRPLPPVLDLPDGSIVQRPKRVAATHAQLFRARSAQVNDQALVLLADGAAPLVPPAAVTGWWRTRHLGAVTDDNDPRLTRRVERDVPLPTGILGLKREVVVG